MKNTITLFALALGMIAVAPQASADQLHRTTKMTFSSPVVVAGTELQAGTYIFERLDASSFTNVTRVLTADGKKTLTMFHTQPEQVNRMTDKVEVEIGADREVLSWTYPGDPMKTVVVD